MKAFFLEADMTTSVTTANKNQTKTKQMSFSKKLIEKDITTNSSGFKNTSVLLLINNDAFLCFL